MALEPDTSADTTSDGTDTSSEVAPASLKGWAAFQYGANVLLPQALSRAESVRQATLRVLAGG